MADLPYKRDLPTQTEWLVQTVVRSPIAKAILDRAPQLRIPNWYLGAGCIAQTVWNVAHGFDPTFGIRDYDLVYFDSTDLSYEAEDAVIGKAREVFDDLGVTVEVKNEARVHLWYAQRFGYDIDAYQSTEDAINTWPTTATSVGVRLDPPTGFTAYAPFGLNDLRGLIVRPNKVQITEEIYHAKVMRWVRLWPKLTIVPWQQVI